MNNSLKIFGFGILALFLMSFASAAITLTPSITTLDRTSGSFDINVSSNVSETITLSNTAIIQDSKIITFVYDPIHIITAGDIHPVHVTYTITDFDFYFGDLYSTNFIAHGDVSTQNATQQISFEVANPAEYADNNKLKVTIDDLSVTGGFGEDEEWYPLDEINAKINVENTNSDTGDDKVKNIYVHWGLYNTNDGEWIASGKESKFTLSDKTDDKLLEINFKLEKLSKIKDHVEDKYVFYAWADGEDATGNGTSDYNLKDIDLKINDNFVILNNLQIAETASCGGNLQVTADIVNIGAEEQDDVYVVIYNKELGINQKVEIGNMDSMEDAKLDASVTLPSDVDEKTYSLTFSVYNEDDEVYQNDNDDESKFSGTFTLEDCTTVPSASVSANLESDAKAGQEFSVKATITNTGSETNTFSIALSGYEEWASLVSIDKTSVALEAGKSADVLINLNANKDVSGEQTFNVMITEGNKILTQPVSVSVARASFFPSISGLISGIKGNNAYLWAVVGANILLVLIIIVVAVKVSKKKE